VCVCVCVCGNVVFCVEKVFVVKFMKIATVFHIMIPSFAILHHLVHGLFRYAAGTCYYPHMMLKCGPEVNSRHLVDGSNTLFRSI
jgi:hypothetical protein